MSHAGRTSKRDAKPEPGQRLAAAGRCMTAAPRELQRQSGNAAVEALLEGRALGALILPPGPGTVLAPALRGTLEAAFGRDLGHVRVHEGPDARATTALLGARAFTAGRDVWLGRDATGDAALLGHEVAHVVQQGASAVPAAPSLAPATGGTEHAAAQAGAAVAAGRAAGSVGSAPAGVQRAPDPKRRSTDELRADPEVSARLEAVGAAKPAPAPESEATAQGIGGKTKDPAAPKAVGDVANALGAPAKQAADPSAAPQEPDRRESQHTQWYLAIEPGSGVVTPKTSMTIRVLNTSGRRSGFHWGNEPVLTVFRDGRQLGTPFGFIAEKGPADTQATPTLRRFSVATPGPVELVVSGRPRSGLPLEVPEPELRLTVRLDVVAEPSAANVAAAGEVAARDERRRLEDPDASPGEIGQAFVRAVGRRAIAVVNGNLKQAEDLKARYASPTTGPAAMKELTLAASLDRELKHARDRRVDALQKLARERLPGSTQLDREAAPIDAEIELIYELRGVVAEAVPGAALLREREGPREDFAKQPKRRAEVVAKMLDEVIADCLTTRNAIVTSDFDVLRSDALVQRMRRELGVDADRGRAAAVDQVIAEYQRRRAGDMIGMAGLSLFLLLVPGIGPFLAAAAGAAVAWEDVLDLEAAANAGIASREEASSARFWAMIDTALAALDVTLAAKGLYSVLVSAARNQSFQAKFAKVRKLSERLQQNVVKAERAQQQFELAAAEVSKALRAAVSTAYGLIPGELFAKAVAKVTKAAYYALDLKIGQFKLLFDRLKLKKTLEGIELEKLTAKELGELEAAFDLGISRREKGLTPEGATKGKQQADAPKAAEGEAPAPRKEPAPQGGEPEPPKAPKDPDPGAGYKPLTKPEYDKLSPAKQREHLTKWMKDHGVSRTYLSDRHHAWPEYLGGDAKQALISLDELKHTKFHSLLDSVLKRRKGTAYYAARTPAQKAEDIATLKRIARDFDIVEGTKISEQLRTVLKGTQYEDPPLLKAKVVPGIP